MNVHDTELVLVEVYELTRFHQTKFKNMDPHMSHIDIFIFTILTFFRFDDVLPDYRISVY